MGVTKIVGMLLMPLPFAIVCLFLGLFFLWLTTRQRLGRCFVTLGFLVLVVFSIAPVSYYILHPLESGYNTYHGSEIPDYIVVLGHGDTPDSDLPPIAQLSDTARSRLLEGVRLYYKYPTATLIFSGGRQKGGPSHALIMSQAAASLGVPKAQMQLFEYNTNTHDEAVSISPIIRDKIALLVTSASHMPRAIALFRTVGTYPIAAPTDVHAKKAYFSRSFWDYVPDIDNLANSQKAIHEWLGRAWALFTGQEKL